MPTLPILSLADVRRIEPFSRLRHAPAAGIGAPRPAMRSGPRDPTP